MSELYFLSSIMPLFQKVQESKIFPDQKTMADAVPKFSENEIMRKYDLESNQKGFDLKQFVNENFEILSSDTDYVNEEQTAALPILEYIELLWDKLERSAPENVGTLIALPKPYIVPGGRFLEFFYWDSYFVMLGLQASKRINLMEYIVQNAAYSIHTFGFVPNGNRTYFLSRSQPPFFSMMIDLLVETTGKQDYYHQYFDTLEKEYAFWMDGSEALVGGVTASKRVVRMKDGEVLNRYYDAENEPRPESYMIDYELEERSKPEFYRNVRAACESGWDFSSRWFADHQNIETIHILDLVQVDLNSLLWNLEDTLSRIADKNGETEKASIYREKAAARKSAINKYFYNDKEKFYCDYIFTKEESTLPNHIAAVFPLYFGIADNQMAASTVDRISRNFLKKGGVVTSLVSSGQQWDYPNAWAPLQWLSYKGLIRYGYQSLAQEIKMNWCNNVEDIYAKTGKIMEKYDAVEAGTIAGGGEYPNQFGFGWTNGVYAKLKTDEVALNP